MLKLGTGQLGRVRVIPDTRNENPIFEKFIKELRSDATRVAYRYAGHWVLNDHPDAFLTLAKVSRREAEQKLIDFILDHKEDVASSTLMNPIRAVKSFLNDQEVFLNWKKIEKKGPIPNKVANDRAPTHEEVRTLLEVCDLKMKAAAMILASSGMRVGAFDYFSLRDAVFQKNGLLKLIVYRGEPEEYWTFASTEAAEALKAYLDSREKYGEKLTPTSPLIRDTWNYTDLLRRKKKSNFTLEDGLPMTAKAVKNQLSFLWVKAGVRKPNDGNRHEFQAAHGFRKFFQSQASKSITNPLMVERLKGKKANYFKPSDEEVEQAYLSAMPHLLISEKYALEEQVQRQETSYAAKDAQTRLDLLESRERIRDLERKLVDLETKPRMSKEEVRKMFNEEFQRLSGKGEQAGS